MAEEDKNKDKLQNHPAKTGDNAAQNFDRLTVLQNAPDSDLSAKPYTADEYMPVIDVPVAVAHAKQGEVGRREAGAESSFSQQTIVSGAAKIETNSTVSEEPDSLLPQNPNITNSVDATVTEASSKKLPLILAVDDDRTLRMMLVNMLEELGYNVMEAQNGRQALDIILERKGEIDALLLDREMPVMNGMELVKRMKENKDLRNMPIIMQTGSDRPEQIKEGIDAGVFYYLTKPVNQDILKSVLSAAIRETEQQRLLSHELKKHKTSFNLIDTCKFKLKTLAEAEHLAAFLANCFPDVERAVGGLAELLINAVEHGNFGISYKEKSELVASSTWREEIERRANLPEYKDKEVTATYRRKPEGFYVTIIDQGKGFDWKNYLHIDPARASDNHGRGIAQANAMSFDKITFNDAGNEVTVYVSNEKTLEW